MTMVGIVGALRGTSTRGVAHSLASAYIVVAESDCTGEEDCKMRRNTCTVGGRSWNGVGVAGGDVEGVGNTGKRFCGACARDEWYCQSRAYSTAS